MGSHHAFLQEAIEDTKAVGAARIVWGPPANKYGF
jgi:hypothetical protein